MQWERNRAKVAQRKKLYVTFLLIREYFILCIYSQEHSQLVIHMSLFLFLLCICSIKQSIVNYWVKNCWMLSSVQFSSVHFRHSVMSDSLWPHESQHARPPCPLPTPEVHPNSCPSSQWCHPAISSSVVPFSSCPQFLPASGSRGETNELTLHMRWPKFWSFSFSISPSNEHPKLISFRMGLVGSPCSPRDPQESSPTPQLKSINSSVLSFLYSPTLTSILDHWKNHSFDQMDLCWQSNVSAF